MATVVVKAAVTTVKTIAVIVETTAAVASRFANAESDGGASGAPVAFLIDTLSNYSAG